MIRKTLVLAPRRRHDGARGRPLRRRTSSSSRSCLSHRRLRRERRAVRQRRCRLLQPGQRARRRRQRRQADLRGVRDRLRHRQGRRMLRAPQGQRPDGRVYVNPLSTGITFALTEKAPADKIPIITMGYGRADSKNGAVFSWNFPLLGTYWSAADIAIQHVAKEMGGAANLKGKKIRSSSTTAPTARSRSRRCRRWPRSMASSSRRFPSRIRASSRSRNGCHPPEPARLRAAVGLGRDERHAIKEAAAVAYPRDKMIGVWWSGAEPDVTPAGAERRLQGLMLQHGAQKSPVHADVEKHVYAKGKGIGEKERSARCSTIVAWSTPCSASRLSAPRKASSATSR